MVLDNPSRVFVLLSAALVQLMTPGLAFFYGGMVGYKSVLTVFFQALLSVIVISLMWWLVGFSLCFGSGEWIYGNPLSFPMLIGVNGNEHLQVNGVLVDDISGATFCVYQLTFAVITPAIMTGAFLDRLRMKAYVPFIVIWFLLVYCPFAHMVWGGGWFEQLGVGDFAGGTVVHITSGWSALASSLILGGRKDQRHEPHNVPCIVLGTSLLWFGWFGFNGGSALSVSGPEMSAAYLNSQLCAASAAACWIFIDMYVRGQPSIVGACLGIIIGLVIITPNAGYCQPWAAVVMGPIGVFFCYSLAEVRRCYFKNMFDDALDVWSSHGVGGLVGCVLVGILSDPAECNPGSESGIATPVWCSAPNSVSRSWSQMGKQLLSASICAAWSFVATVAILLCLSKCMDIRIPFPDCENVDAYELGELAYDIERSKATTAETSTTASRTNTNASVATETSTAELHEHS